MGAWGFRFLGLWDCLGCDLDVLGYTQASASPRGDRTGAVARIPGVTDKCLSVGALLLAV